MISIQGETTSRFDIEMDMCGFVLKREADGGDWLLTTDTGEPVLAAPWLAAGRTRWQAALARALSEIGVALANAAMAEEKAKSGRKRQAKKVKAT